MCASLEILRCDDAVLAIIRVFVVEDVFQTIRTQWPGWGDGIVDAKWVDLGRDHRGCCHGKRMIDDGRGSGSGGRHA